MAVDADTKNWILDASDDRAVATGCVMDLEMAAHHIDWIEDNCRLYEGDGAGEPLKLLGYQVSFLVRLHGWRMWSDEWNAWIRRFRKAGLWAAKKNGKSPFLAAVGLDLLINDDESGQKVYNGAKNGDQARISQLHAYKMVEMSPSLNDECQTYKNTLEIFHKPTNSRMLILTGDNSRGHKAKEGLNGSVFFDEMHVVDRGLYERVSRAGISRRQPLEFSASTSGDDPGAIGRERFDYGRQVASGERDDFRFLHVEYCVPDGTRESQIISEPLKYGPMANPAWGALIKPSEFIADLNNSKGRSREMARFMQYRCNLWIGSTNRWLDVQSWEACGREIGIEELRGRECYMGLDMARRLDMASAVFAFPWPEAGDDGVLFWPLLWLPEATAKDRDLLFPMLTWGLEGHLNITRGEVLDYDVIKRDIRQFVNGNEVQLINLYYDIKYANEITQSLCEGETDGDGHSLIEGFGCDRTEFKQDVSHLTGPCVELERRILSNSVRHPNNAVLDWQVGHCEVWTDRNQNIRPVKPEPHSGKSVDGVVAMVMAMYGVDSAQRNLPRVHG